MLFFKNMNKYSAFKNVSDKTLLCGIDSTIIMSQYKHGNKLTDYFLSTPGNALFNVNGKISLKDSVIYFSNDFSNNMDSIQILFNFKQKKSEWIYYSRNEKNYFLSIRNEGNYYNKQIEDNVFIFRILKDEDRIFEDVFYLEISLKWGIASLIYWEEGYTISIDIINQKIIKRLSKFSSEPFPRL
jgi:hypothetical protein